MIPYVYIYSQKFDTVAISVIRGVTKICKKKSSILKMSRRFILHNKNSEK